jgi:hypothetical protein
VETRVVMPPRAFESLPAKLKRHEEAAIWSTAGALFIFAVLALFDRHLIGATSPLFWDLPVYRHAVELLAEGKNPYDSALLHDAGVSPWLFFISPPAVMMLFTGIANTPLRHVLEPTLYALHVVAILGTPFLLGRLLFGPSPARIALAIGGFITLFAAAGLGAVSAMNNGSVLNFFVVAGAVAGFRRRRWTGFHIAVVIAAIFKPYYVFFWILPVLAHGFNWRQIFIGAALAALAALFYIMPLWLAPDIFDAWRSNVMTTLSIGDDGSNVFGVFNDWVASTGLGTDLIWLPAAAQLAYITLLVALLLVFPLKGPALWAACLLSAVFMNPRPLAYDLALAAIPLIFLTAMLLPRAMSMGWRLTMSTWLLTATMLVLCYNNRIAPAGGVFPIVVAGVLLAIIIVRAKKAPSRPRSHQHYAVAPARADPALPGNASHAARAHADAENSLSG